MWKINLSKEYAVLLDYLLHVPFCHSKKLMFKLRKNSKGYPLEEWSMEKKLHLVNWLIVCLGKSRGGIGIRNLSFLNKSLFRK